MKDKVAISIDESLLRFVDLKRGDVPRSKFIENCIKAVSKLYQALWVFRDELKDISWTERWLSVHTSQPIGKPLHKHEGYVTLNDGQVSFYDIDFNQLYSARIDGLRDIQVGYDDSFRRWKDSRGFIPPLHFEFERRRVYLFIRPIGRSTYKGDSEPFLTALRSNPGIAALPPH